MPLLLALVKLEEVNDLLAPELPAVVESFWSDANEVLGLPKFS